MAIPHSGHRTRKPHSLHAIAEPMRVTRRRILPLAASVSFMAPRRRGESGWVLSVPLTSTTDTRGQGDGPSGRRWSWPSSARHQLSALGVAAVR